MTSSSACLSFQSLDVIQRSSRGDAARHDLLQDDADLLLVAVDGRAVKVAVAEGSRILHRVGDLLRRDVVRAECAQANGGHAVAGVEYALGDKAWIDAVFRDRKYC